MQTLPVILVMILLSGCGSDPSTPGSAAGTPSDPAPLTFVLDDATMHVDPVDAVLVAGSQPSVAISGSHLADDGTGTTLSLKVFQFNGAGTYAVEVVDGGLVASIMIRRMGGAFTMVNTQAAPGSGAVIEVTEYDEAAALISGRFSGTVSDGTYSWVITDGTFEDLPLRSM